MNTRYGARAVLLAAVLCWLAAAAVTPARAEKEDSYTAADEFLPLGAEGDGGWEVLDQSYLQDPDSVKQAELEGLRLHKEEQRLVFSVVAPDSGRVRGRELYHSITYVSFPPRLIVVLYGVRSTKPIRAFFKDLPILGIVLNPFLDGDLSEYFVFFRDAVSFSSSWDAGESTLTVRFASAEPDVTRGYGVRVADSRIDPLPHVIEIKKELTRYGLPNHLLLASDRETVVLESPFYPTRKEAVAYLESLENFGYRGKLALRQYQDFPEPHRSEVVSEVVITGEDEVNLKNLAYTELPPTKVHRLAYHELHRIILPMFSPRLQEDPGALAEQYYQLSEIYLNFESEDSREVEQASAVALRILEIIYFQYPETERADDALWDMANLMRQRRIRGRLSERECYRRLLAEYPRSMFAEEAARRLQADG
ncbi:MAG: tetratricopeptide repeat protein [Spirochaetota bacterium]